MTKLSALEGRRTQRRRCVSSHSPAESRGPVSGSRAPPPWRCGASRRTSPRRALESTRKHRRWTAGASSAAFQRESRVVAAPYVANDASVGFCLPTALKRQNVKGVVSRGTSSRRCTPPQASIIDTTIGGRTMSRIRVSLMVQSATLSAPTNTKSCESLPVVLTSPMTRTTSP